MKVEIEGEVKEGEWDDAEYGPHTPFYVRRRETDPMKEEPAYVPQGVKNLINDHKSSGSNTVNVFVVASLFAENVENSGYKRIEGVAFHRSIAWDYLEAELRNSLFIAPDIAGNIGFWAL